jgi:hypothetical protein
MIDGEKIFSKVELDHLTSEEEFIKRFKLRKPLSQKELYEKFCTKYETIFKWLLVGTNKREAFWDVLKRDASKNLLNCYEIRLEEIVESFTGSSKKYWKNQKGIAARKKRTALFKSDIFKNRRSNGECYGWETFGNREGSFAKKVHFYVRHLMMTRTGDRLEGVNWEDALLYTIAINGDFFGTGMMALSEKQCTESFVK